MVFSKLTAAFIAFAAIASVASANQQFEDVIAIIETPTVDRLYDLVVDQVLALVMPLVAGILTQLFTYLWNDVTMSIPVGATTLNFTGGQGLGLQFGFGSLDQVVNQLLRMVPVVAKGVGASFIVPFGYLTTYTVTMAQDDYDLLTAFSFNTLIDGYTAIVVA